jgi:hypothetical protein
MAGGKSIMWIATITINGNSGVEKKDVMAPTLVHVYTKLYKYLCLGVLEIHVRQNEGK